MPVSDVDIANWALAHCQESSITSLDGSLKRQETLKTLYEPIKHELLTEIDWPFATHTQQLALDAATPADTRFTKQYSLPTDPLFLKLQHTQPNENHMIQGDKYLANANSVLMTYTADVAEDIMPRYFAWLLGLKVGSVICMPLTKNRSLKKSIEEDFDKYWPKATFAASSQQPNKPVADQPFIDARF